MVKTVALVVTLSLLFVLALGNGDPVYAQQQQTQPQVTCDPFFSGIASFVIPGWGQWMNGERSKAVTHIVVGLGLVAGGFLLAGTPAGLLAWGARSVWGLYSTYDAFASCVAMYEDVDMKLPTP
jgi:hypothetical protein